MLWNEIGRFGQPWREFGNVEQRMKKVQEEMNRLFSGVTHQTHQEQPDFPAINLWQSENTATVTCEVAGISPEKLDITVVGKTLTIKGSRPKSDVAEGESYHRRERWEGDFTRSVEIPFDVDSDKVEAKFKDGVLYIALPRTGAEKPRKIEVRSS